MREDTRAREAGDVHVGPIKSHSKSNTPRISLLPLNVLLLACDDRAHVRVAGI